MRSRPGEGGPEAVKANEAGRSLMRRWMQLGLTGRMFLLVVIAVLPALVIQAVNEYALRTSREDLIVGLFSLCLYLPLKVFEVSRI